MVRFIPTWTVTVTPFTSISVFPFRYQPSDPVENSFGWAVILFPLITTSTGLAPSTNCWRVTGQDVLAIGNPPGGRCGMRGILPAGEGRVSNAIRGDGPPVCPAWVPEGDRLDRPEVRPHGRSSAIRGD